jgi:hypothetical protein
MPYVPKDPLVWRVIKKVDEPVGCLIMILWMMIVVPLSPFLIYGQRWRRSRFIKRLSANGRLLSWGEFLVQTQNESGSVVMEVGKKAKPRFWWTRDRILSIAPMAPPRLREQEYVAFGGANYHPFARWCYEHYLSPETGSAFLTYPEKDDVKGLFSLGDDCEERIQERFPNQDVVVLTFYDARYV